MSRTPSTANIEMVRGATWIETWDYADEDGNPIDLDGYEARMQVREKDYAYGTTTSTTLLAEFLSAGDGAQLEIVIPPGGSVKSRVQLRVEAEDNTALNASNERKAKYAYGLELYIPEATDPEYVLPLAQGDITAHGERVR